MNRRKVLLGITILYTAVLIPAAALCKSAISIVKEKKKKEDEKKS